MRWPRWFESLWRSESAVAPSQDATPPDADLFLADIKGVVHVGAWRGPERHLYQKHGLEVLWVEANPDVFAQLQQCIRDFPGQIAFQALVTDVDGQEYDFHISSNHGASSSIYDFKHHKEIWPQVHFTGTKRLESTTLTTLFRREGISPERYQALVLDTQGAELLVLRGAESLLPHFRYVKTEVADFESYEGCCQLRDIEPFMEQHGYREMNRKRFAGSEGVGNYYDIVYRR